MSFENLQVRRVVLHEVYKRRHDGSIVNPRRATQLIVLSADAMNVFRERVVDAMGAASQSMEMEIADAGRDSAVELASSLLGISDDNFITVSSGYADKLTSAQVARNLPGGILVVFEGTVTAASLPFIGAIKAEKQSGFRETRSSIQFLSDLFLTPASKLYKIGFFMRQTANGQDLAENWKAFVYDSHMTTANRNGAAKYFFELFLGCKIPENSAYLTRVFFDSTRQFIREMDVAIEVKEDLLTSLYTYLKVDQTPTIQVSSFSTSYLPPDSHDNYSSFMQSKDFPLTAIQKDTENLNSILRKRRVKFSGSIELTAPPESFDQLIDIETIPAEDPTQGQPQNWTRITVKDQISGQE